MKRQGIGLGWLGLLMACQGPAALPPPVVAPVVAAAPLAPPAPVPVVVELPVDVQVQAASGRLGQATLGVVLARAGLSPDTATRVINALSKTVDPRRMRPSDVVAWRVEDRQLTVLTVGRVREDGVPEEVALRPGQAGSYVVARSSDEVRVETRQLGGRVVGTLYDSILALKETPQLINQVVDVFDSQMDFYREVQNGDAFKVIVEKRFAGDRFIGYGRVLAAEYQQGRRTLRGFSYTDANGRTGHYDENGRSLLTAFLKTPMEFTRITSRFGMRFHPVLKERRAHNGVDYGAPTGTPVWSVGEGRVVSARDEGACGNAVMIQHPNGYLTGYCHLSRFGAGMRAGVHINQKQIIGYVGTTGRSTAPHLHFLMKKGGGYVNPQRVETPRAVGLSGADLKRYKQDVGARLTDLAAMPSA